MSGSVIVPVEPTEAMMNACPSSFSPSFAAIWPKVCRDIYQAMLTAAPVREEGGALDDRLHNAISKLKDWVSLIQLRKNGGCVSGNPIVDCVNDLPVIIRELEAAELEIEGAFEALEDAALATREEAPADAGEDDGLFLLMKRGLYYRPNAMGYTGIKDHAGRYTKAETENHADPISGVTAIAAIDAPDFSPACFDDLARAHLVGKLEQATRELSALRAQPPAREDAQPVGWLRAVDEEMVCAHLGVADAEDSFETAKKKLASIIQWNIAVATDPSAGGHPVPDALRVAVEALEKAARRFESLREATDHIPHRIACSEWAEEARQALAARQAEQKGGA